MTVYVPSTNIHDPAWDGGATYRYFLCDTLTGAIFTEIPMKAVTYSRQLRKAGEMQGTLSVTEIGNGVDAYNWTMPARSSVFITRHDPLVPNSETCVWGGMIWSREYALAAKEVTIHASTYESYLYHRAMWHDAFWSKALDEYEVVRDLLYTLATDFEIQASKDPDPAYAWDVAHLKMNTDVLIEPESPWVYSGKHQDDQYVYGTNLGTMGQKLEDFSDNIGGFEYYIECVYDPLPADGSDPRFRRIFRFRDTPPSQYAFGDRYTGSRPGLDNIVFESPGNIIDLTYTESAEQSGNRVWCVGAAPSSSPSTSTTATTDTNVQVPSADNVNDVSHKPRGFFVNQASLDAGFPVLDYVDATTYSNTLTDPQSLRDRAQIMAGQVATPIETMTLTYNGSIDPVIGTYEPGDWCRIVIRDDPFILNRMQTTGEDRTGIVKRIMAWQVTVPVAAGLPEIVSLTLLDEWDTSNLTGQ